MTIKTMPPMKILYHEARTTLKGLDEQGSHVVALYQEAARQQLIVCGPMYWFYFGADGNPETEFTLQIVVPVNKKPEETGRYKFRHVPEFKCSTQLHKGSWAELAPVYKSLIPETLAAGYELAHSDECREMYLNTDFEQGDNCLTEVQIGLE